MPYFDTKIPDGVSAALLSAFESYPELAQTCGFVEAAVPQAGLSNRVYRLTSERGAFFLRLPRAETAGMVDRFAEAQNICQAVALGIALPPLFCSPEAGILLTQAIEPQEASGLELPVRLGAVLAYLHGSGVPFQGRLAPDVVIDRQIESLAPFSDLSAEIAPLVRALREVRLKAEDKREEDGGLILVPSHGDLSPGNCLSSGKALWLIDWEYSGMADPAWDLAYAALEHGFSEAEEQRFLAGYRSGGGQVPAPLGLTLMKALADTVSALWAYEQLMKGSAKTDFRTFARLRRDRALSHLDSF